MTTEEVKSPEGESAQNKEPTKKELDIQRSLEEIAAERKEKDEQQRFGYFSVPYPASIGDQAYSQKQEYHHKVVDRKVITENRGIYAQGPKSGKGPDVYFPPPESTEKLMKQKEERTRNNRKKEIKRKKSFSL